MIVSIERYHMFYCPSTTGFQSVDRYWDESSYLNGVWRISEFNVLGPLKNFTKNREA